MRGTSLPAAFLASMAIAVPAAAEDDRLDRAMAQIEALQAELRALQAEVSKLRVESDAAATPPTAVIETQSALITEQGTRLDAVEVAATNDIPAIAWKGAPVISGDGWSFKPRGRLMFDAGVLNTPGAVALGGTDVITEVRRARLGFEGVILSDFNYKFEVDFADNEVEIADAIISYETGNTEIGVGFQKTGQSLEEEASSRFTTFIERAAFTDAFAFGRRVGLRVDHVSGDLRLTGTVMSASVGDLAGDNDNNQWSVGGRVLYAAELSDTSQVHIGASALYTDLSDSEPNLRYRQRPNWHGTNIRLVDTGIVQATDETIYGVEALGIFGPLHVTGEALFADISGRSGGPGDGSARGGYAEVGYFLTGETLGYKGGTINRTKILSPLGNGGAGAFQIAARYDHLDLNGGILQGGTQGSYQLGLTWIPMDYLRFLLNYNHLEIDGGPFGAAADRADGDYVADVVAVRASIDF
ncbi:MAG: porin [Pacificimonas sp.]